MGNNPSVATAPVGDDEEKRILQRSSREEDGNLRADNYAVVASSSSSL